MTTNDTRPVRVIDVQATEERFKDMLTEAFPDAVQRIDGDTIHLEEGPGAVQVRLYEQPDRHLGSLDLPMERVRFEFEGHSEAEADDFMERYRTATMRTGG